MLNTQDWAPIRLDDKAHLVAQEEELTLINTIWIDSVTIIDGNSTFHLNRVVKFENLENWNLFTNTAVFTKNDKQK